MLPTVVRARRRWRAPRLWLAALAAASFLVAVVMGASAVVRWYPGPPAIHAGNGPDALAVTPDGRTLYVASDPAGTVTPVTRGDRHPGHADPCTRRPDRAGDGTHGRTLYVVINGDIGPGVPGAHLVVPLTLATGIAGAPIQLGSGPVAAAVTPDGRTLFVAGTDDKVTLITAATGTAGRAFRVVPILGQVRGDAAALAVTPNGRTFYVADESQNAVAAIALTP